MIISGFPGIGKSWFTKYTTLDVSDSDSIQFSWKEKGIRHPDFPNNYINHILGKAATNHIVLVSSHAVVRKAMQDWGINYMLVYPHPTCKREYLERYMKRGSPEAFLKLLDEMWSTWVQEMRDDPASYKYELTSGEFICDAMQDIFKP